MNEFERALQTRICEYLDGTLTPDEFELLDRELASNPEAARLFAQYAHFDGVIEQFYSREKSDLEAQRILLSLGLRTDGDGLHSPEDSRLPGVRDTSLASSGLASKEGVTPAALSLARFLRMGNAVRGLLATAALALVVAGVYWLQANARPEVAQTPRQVAKIISSIDAVWSGYSTPGSNGWLPDGAVQLSHGEAEIRFVSGVVVVLKAPAEFQAISMLEARLKYGAITARVSNGATRFRIHTPTAEVVDLGTEFGVSVANSGETNVAVFDGIVDVSSGPNGGDSQNGKSGDAITDPPPRRLTAGEALGVDWEGDFRRIETVSDDSFPSLDRSRVKDASHRPSLIANVTDNLRNGDENPHFYRIVSQGFGEDVLAFVDRRYEWNGANEEGIPPFLIGADYIMPFNNNKWAENFEMTITLARPAIVFVLFDDRGPAPAWLQESFVDTGFDIGLDEGPLPQRLDHQIDKGPGVSVDYVFSVWKRDVAQPEPVVLGPRGGLSLGRSMYGIVVTPLDSQ